MNNVDQRHTNNKTAVKVWGRYFRFVIKTAPFVFAIIRLFPILISASKELNAIGCVPNGHHCDDRNVRCNLSALVILNCSMKNWYSFYRRNEASAVHNDRYKRPNFDNFSGKYTILILWALFNFMVGWKLALIGLTVIYMCVSSLVQNVCKYYRYVWQWRAHASTSIGGCMLRLLVDQAIGGNRPSPALKSTILGHIEIIWRKKKET